MLKKEYNELYPEKFKNWKIWLEETYFDYLGKEGFIDKVNAKINEEPENPNYYIDLFDHYLLIKELKKALEVINVVIDKFPELKDYSETVIDKNLYISGETIEEWLEFREFFNNKEELIAARERVSSIILRFRPTLDEKLNRMKELVAEEPGNPVFQEGLWELYIRRFELDKAKEVALKIIDIAKEKGVKKVVLKWYMFVFIDSLDITECNNARNIYNRVYEYGDKSLITPEIKAKYGIE